MAYTPLPANLYDYFSTINQRLRKLESAPDMAYTTAVSAQGTAAQASTQATQAYTAALQAGVQATAASLQAGVALQSANGKNTVHYSTSGPSGSGSSGDVWFQTDSYGTVLYQYVYNGSSWVNAPIASTVIAALDAGKITTGTLQSIAIYAGSSGQFQVSSAGALVATQATIQGTITANSGSFTGTLTSTSGTIGGFTLSATGLSNATSSIYINSSSATVYGTTVNAGNGGMTSSNTITATGTLTGNGYVYFPTTATTYTTSSSANLYINPSYGNLARSTSSARYKVDIEPQAIPVQSVMSLTAKSFIDKIEYKNNKESTQGLTRYLGLIAEEVAEIDTLKDFLVVYTEDGLPDAINYDRVAVALLPLVQDLQNRVTKLEGANGTGTSTTS